MAKNCPYCGEKQSALKNHVRLTSGGGHGPPGQYPDDFERADPDGDDHDPDGGASAPVPAPSADGTSGVLEEPPEPQHAGAGEVEHAGPQELPEYDDQGDEETDLVAFTEEEFQEVADTIYAHGQHSAEVSQTDESDDVIDVESTTVEDAKTDEKSDESDESASSGGWSVGRFLWWAFVVVAGTVLALRKLIGNGDDGQTDEWNSTDPAFGGGFDDNIPGV